MYPKLSAKKHKSFRKRKPEPIFTDYQTYWEDTPGLEVKLSKFTSTELNYKPEYDFVSLKYEGLSLPAYMNEQIGKSIYRAISFEYSLSCNHSWISDELTGHYVCTKCLAVDNQIIRNMPEYHSKQANQKIWRRDHDRQRWTNLELEYVSGMYMGDLNDYTWLFILREVPERFCWLDVFKVFRKYEMNKEWLSFGKFIGLEIKMDRRIAAYAEKYTDHKMCKKYRISYLYLVYKFVQLFYEGFEVNIPLKKSTKWFEEKGDVWWKDICEENQFLFKKSKIHYITWKKKEFLQTFVKTMRNMGIGTS